MRKPARIKPHLSAEELSFWVRSAPTRESYQKRLAVWLTYIGSFHAHEVATMLQVSTQAVWLWVGQYNRYGVKGLEREGRGGRRWSYLSLTEEENILRLFFERAAKGEVITAKQLHPVISKAAGKEVSLDYVYRVLHRHAWRKIGPRPRHIKADLNAQQEFKKNSHRLSKRHS